MTIRLTDAFEVVSIALKHGIELDDADDPAGAIEHLLQVMRDRSRLAKTDIRTLEALAVDIADHQARDLDNRHAVNGAAASIDHPATQEA